MKTRFYKTLFVLSEFILMSLCCYADAPTSVTDGCGKTYPVIRVGDVLWMAENLACTKYDTESEAYKSGFTELSTGYEIYSPYYADVKNSSSDYDDKLTQAIRNKMGLVYNWAAVMGYKTESESKAQTGDYIGIRQGICPNGWHVPSRAEVSKLIQAFGDANTAGYHLKATEGWHNNGNGDNSSGFAMYPSGTHVTAKTSNAIGRNGYVSLCDAKSASEHHDLNFYWDNNKADDDGCSKKYAQSVRCIYDLKYYKLTANSADEEQGTVTGSGTYLEGESATIVAIPNTGYQFKNWSNGLEDNPAEITVTSDTTLTANFEKIKYNVKFVNYDGTLLQDTVFEYGDTPQYTGDEPLKPADNTYTYQFSGEWEPAITTATKDTTYTAQFTPTYKEYKIETRTAISNSGTVTITDSEGQEYGSSGTFHYGDVITLTATPAKETWLLKRWSTGSTENPLTYTVQDSAKIVAFILPTEIPLTITLDLNSAPSEGGETTGSGEYGTVYKQGTTEPEYVSIAIKATPNNGYKFVNWTELVDGEQTVISDQAEYIISINKNTTYSANFEKKNYIITFRDYNGKKLKQDIVKYGDTPTCPDPERESSAEYTYNFAGWNPSIKAADGNTTYFATYTATKKQYTIKFACDGNILQEEQLDYGTTPTYKGETPTREPSAQYTYTFKGWDYAISPVRGNFTYNAVFDKTVNTYLVRFENYDKTELETNTVAYGEMPNYYGENPKKESTDPAYRYVFAGWEPSPTVVTGDATYTATYIQELNIFHVDAVSDDVNKGTVAGSGDYQAGSVATLTAQPKKGYALDYWSNGEKTASISIVVNKDTTVTAYFGRQNADNTPACNNAASASKYNWLIMLDLNTLNAEGYTFTENQVRWYKVVGEMDNLSDPDYLRNDEFLKNGYYLTLDKSLTGTGTYYGLIDLVNQSDNVGCQSGIMRTEPHKYDATEKKSGCTLLKTVVEPQETLEIINLPKGVKSHIRVFDSIGNAIYETVSDGIETLQFNAASIPGTYMVTISDESTKQTLRYIVK
ncbi:MAG: hypothetical protein MJ007_03045 [Paludibacteraceae bacterium]|nr:hypothetical protein [Paludibacteraceae bacterium]